MNRQISKMNLVSLDVEGGLQIVKSRDQTSTVDEVDGFYVANKFFQKKEILLIE